MRFTLDDDSVGAVRGGRPLRGQVCCHPIDVLDGDHRSPADHPGGLGPDGADGARRDRSAGDVQIAWCEHPLVRLVDPLKFDAESLGHQPDRRTPGELLRTVDFQQGGEIERLTEPHRGDQQIAVRVGGVVEDLLRPDGTDGVGQRGEQHRELVAGKARLDTGGVDGGATGLGRGAHPIRQVGNPSVREHHSRRVGGHDIDPGAQ